MVRAATTETNPDGGTSSIDRDCDCHFFIDDVSVEQVEDGAPSVTVQCSVVGCSDREMIGRKHGRYDSFGLGGKAATRFFLLCVKAGIMTQEFWAQAKAANQDIEIDENLLKGRQFCGGVRMEPYRGTDEKHKGKKFPRLGFRIGGVHDKEWSHVPKDPDLLPLAGPAPQQQPPAAGGTAGVTAPQSPPQPAAPATAQAQQPQAFGW